jgi:cytochrome c oxidase cbb3-type subunit 3
MWYRTLCLLVPAAVFAQAPDDAARGESIFLSQCSFCHGQSGEGGRGSPLTRSRLRHAPDDMPNDAALSRVIRGGIPDTGMPGSPLNDQEIQLVAAHVRKLGRVAAGSPPGDPVRGEQIYNTKGACARCHTIHGRGGAFGPDLTAIGERRSAAHLRESVINPGAEIAPGFLQIRATMSDGRAITGARVNEDTFTVQIRDVGGTVHSLEKSGLRAFHKDAGTSPMPGYGTTLTGGELDDLVAFLVRQQEAP